MKSNALQGWFEKHNKQLLPAGALSAIFTLWFSWYRGLSFVPDKTLPLFVLCFVLSVYGLKRAQKRCNWVCAALAGLLLFFQVAGHTVRTVTGGPREWSLSLALPFAFIALVFFVLLRGLASLCQSVVFASKNDGVRYGKKLWLIFFAALLAMWLPALLVLGPRLSPDSTWVLSQAIGSGLNDAHPVAYTLLLRLIAKPFFLAGNITAGVYLFCFLQMVFVAAVLSCSLYWLYRRGCGLWCCCLGAAYFTFTTVFAVNSITIWKDIPFNAVLLLLVMFLYDNYLSEGELIKSSRGCALFCALSLAICFLRGNGWSLMLVVTLALVAAYLRKSKKLIICMVPLLIAVKLITGPLYAELGIANSSSVTERAALPIQQVARVVATGGDISPEELEFIDNIMDVSVMAEAYNPISVDYIKGNAAFNSQYLNEHLGEFLRVWLSLAPKNPSEYLNAWLLETLGYWHVGFRGTAGVYYNDYNGFAGVNQTDILSPLLGEDLTSFYLENSTFISLAAMAVTALFAAAIAIIRRDGKRLVVLSVLLAVWLGLMIGAPTYWDFRYMLVFAYSLPVLLFLIIDKRKTTPLDKAMTSGTE